MILVTGGNGFIGRYVVAELVSRGFEPLVFDRHAAPDSETFLGDIRDAGAVTEAMAHASGWIHLAGVLGTQETIANPTPAAETNIFGGLNILAAASQYAVPGVNIAVGNYWMENTYSISKHTIERFAAMYRRERGTAVSSVRAFNAYGPGQSIAAPYGDSKVRKIVPAFACRALTGSPIEIYGDGSQIMDMVYAGDVARVLVDVLAAQLESGEAYDQTLEAGSARPTTVLEIAQTVLEIAGRDPDDVVFLPMRPGEPPSSTVLAEKPWPLAGGYRELEDGLSETLDALSRDWLPQWLA